ncbi:unnamed protein product [Parnassius apollo]|uniref:(apollo) hypothetical protein n=1 Tax=Parnassius apollo TaxID=110799 RepID=A0A8S3WE63_PARAO|nr:unnamed protein product [Parnassius apollo]
MTRLFNRPVDNIQSDGYREPFTSMHAGVNDDDAFPGLFESHQLYRVAGPSQEIGALEAHLDIISQTPAVRSTSGQLEALIKLSPEAKQKWLQYFNQKQISYTKIVDNLADILRDEEAKNIRAKYDSKQNGSSIWNAYHGHEEINNYLDDLAEQYPNLFTVVNAALTYEGRQIKYVRISTTRFEEPRKRVVVVDAGMHAREWLPVLVALNVIHRLVVDIVNNPQMELLDWVVIPLVNPDGYEYSIRELYRVAGPAQEIGALEANLDIISATSAARSASGQLEALVRLAQEDKQKWLQYFDQKEMSYTKIVDNLADILWDEEAKTKRAKYAAKRSGKSISWDTYYRYEEINDYLDELGEQHPNLVTVINPGLSYEGRQIKYVRISTTRFEDLRKPVIIIDAAVHAREWITPPVALYIINQLVVDIVDNDLTERLDWVIIPLANPDGYEYSITEDRMWRKTRSKAHDGAEECLGVDGNRNFDHYWGTSEASADPCSLIYEGPAPFSEPEIRVIRDVIMQNLNRAVMYISLHSFGSMFLYAWGNNGTLPSNGLTLHVAGVRMATAIEELALEKADPYIVGNAANVLYYSTGTSRDWTRAVGIPLTYTLELPGYEYGFLLPPEYIEQIVKETWYGIAAGAHYVLSLYN